MRHRVLLGRGQHDLARQPVQQEGLGLRRAHPQRAAEVLVTAVVNDVVGGAAGGLAIRKVLGLVGGQKLGHQHRPAVLAPSLAPGRPGAARRAGGAGGAALIGAGGRLARLGRRQRVHPRPDERVVGRERAADRRIGRLLGDRQGRLQQPARVRGLDLRERGSRLAAVVEQLGHLRGHPAVPRQATCVVVDDDDEGMLVLAGVAEHAHDFVAVTVGVGVQVALGRDHGTDVLGPSRPGDAALHQRQGRLLRAGRLAGRAQARDAGQQCERGRAALLGGVGDEPLADELLDIGPAAPEMPGAGPAATLLAPPGAEQLAHHELGVEWAADGEQLPRGPQHLGEQCIRRRRGICQARPLPRRAGMPVMPRPAWRVGASARRVHRASLSDASRPMPCPGAACRPFVPVSSPLSASARDPMPSLRPVPLMATHSGTKLTLAAPPAASARWTVRHGCLYRAMEHEVGLPTRDRDVGPPGGSGGHGG